MIRFLIFLKLVLLSSLCSGQKNIDTVLKKLNQNSVTYITIDSLALTKNHILLDTREKEEFTVSHLKNAIWVGYDSFNIETVTHKIKDKTLPITVYCSIGVRSEDIGEKLIAKGYTNVKNLYGGIFEWKKNGYPVYDNTKKETNKVHAFSKQWGKLLTNAKKVY